MLDALELDSLDDAMLALTNRYGSLLDETALQSIRKRVTHALKDATFRQLCSGELYKEAPVSIGGELRYIDLLVKREEGYVIIDYKSSQSHQSEHIAQVSGYKEALSQITQENVEAYICYALENATEFLEI